MKKIKEFQFRMSTETKEQLEMLKSFYQISAASVIRMLISREVKKIEGIQGGKNE